MTKLTLGPIAYHWSAETRRDFYARIADEAPLDEVYLGEVICSNVHRSTSLTCQIRSHAWSGAARKSYSLRLRRSC